MTLRILDKLYASDTNLTKADLALLEYVKAKGLDACNAPISEIAKSCGVSHATVTRFARKFGFDSLQAFKIALAQELGPSDNQGHLIAVNISYDESSEVTARKLDELSTSTIHHTVQLIDHEVLRKITQRLTNAHRLFFIGKGNSGFAASDSAYKFNRIGIDTRAITDTHEMLMQSTMLNKRDVVVAFSNTGETKEIIKAVQLAKNEHAKVIAVSAQPESTLCQLADEVLIYAIRESYLDSGSIYSKLAVFFLIDLVYTEVCKHLGEHAVATKRKTALALQELDGPSTPDAAAPAAAAASAGAKADTLSAHPGAGSASDKVHEPSDSPQEQAT